MSTDYREVVRDLPLKDALWWFIENVNEATEHRTEIFFALRERMREEQSAAPAEPRGLQGVAEATRELYEHLERTGALDGAATARHAFALRRAVARCTNDPMAAFWEQACENVDGEASGPAAREAGMGGPR